MAARTNSLIAIFVVMAVCSSAMGADFMVGDKAGWDLGVNYTEWAKGKTFHVGDKLMFMYNASKHNVLKVNGTNFKDCVKTNPIEAPNTGSDWFTLAKPGKTWYICGVGEHCKKGMKLVINVEGAQAPTPSSPTSAASQFSPLKYSLALTLSAIAFFNMIIAA